MAVLMEVLIVAMVAKNMTSLTFFVCRMLIMGRIVAIVIAIMNNRVPSSLHDRTAR